jgi:transposase InsO family protein
VLSVAFAIDCHDREVFAWTASPRPLNGDDIRTLMDRMQWARFGEAALKVRASSRVGSTTTTPERRTRRSGCEARLRTGLKLI